MDLKLNTQETRNQSDRELPKITGRNPNLPCGCACRYVNEPEGSSYGDNGNAYDTEELRSPGGTSILLYGYGDNDEQRHFYN